MNATNKDLISNNMKLIYKYCARYGIKSEDTMQDLFLNMCEKIDDFDSTKAKFSTYIYMCCDSYLKNEHTNKSRQKRNIDDIDIIHITTRTNADIEIEDDYRFEDGVVFEDLLNQKIKNKVHKKMFKLKAMGYTHKEIGEKLGYTKQHVQHTINKYKQELIKGGF